MATGSRSKQVKGAKKALNLYSLYSEFLKVAQSPPPRHLQRLFARKVKQIRRERLSLILDHAKGHGHPTPKFPSYGHRRTS